MRTYKKTAYGKANDGSSRKPFFNGKQPRFKAFEIDLRAHLSQDHYCTMLLDGRAKVGRDGRGITFTAEQQAIYAEEALDIVGDNFPARRISAACMGDTALDVATSERRVRFKKKQAQTTPTTDRKHPQTTGGATDKTTDSKTDSVVETGCGDRYIT